MRDKIVYVRQDDDGLEIKKEHRAAAPLLAEKDDIIIPGRRCDLTLHLTNPRLVHRMHRIGRN